jgi:hypothetical protein
VRRPFPQWHAATVLLPYRPSGRRGPTGRHIFLHHPDYPLATPPSYRSLGMNGQCDVKTAKPRLGVVQDKGARSKCSDCVTFGGGRCARRGANWCWMSQYRGETKRIVPRALHCVADACASGGQSPFVNSRRLVIGPSEFRSKAQNSELKFRITPVPDGFRTPIMFSEAD